MLSLEEECELFSRYLIGEKPTSYVLEKYADAHENADLPGAVHVTSFDSLLLEIATFHPVTTAAVDSYTAIFCSRAIFRQKIVVLLSILESSSPSYLHFESPDPSSKAVLLLKMLAKVALFGVRLLVSMVVFLPLQSMSKLLSITRVR